MTWLYRLSLPLCLLAYYASSGQACSIPVFRYALERWNSDQYEVVIYYRGELSAEDRGRVEALEDLSARNGGTTNLEVVRANLDGDLSPDQMKLWDSLDDPPLPHVVVRVPLGGKGLVETGKCPLTELTPAAFASSPARQEVCRRLLAGDSVVWLIVGDKQAKAFQQARKSLDEMLPKLAEDIPLPQGVGQPGSELFAKVPLAVQFSVLEVDPADPAEAWLLRTLVSQAPASAKPSEPLVAAVFGRGRVVDLFRAEEFDDQVAADVSRFLCGACSCQVKQLNPGFDLLTSTPWEQRLFGEENVPEAVSLQPPGTAVAPASPTLVTIPGSKSDRSHSPAPGTKASARTSASESSSAGLFAWDLLGVAALFLVAVLLPLGVSRFRS